MLKIFEMREKLKKSFLTWWGVPPASQEDKLDKIVNIMYKQSQEIKLHMFEELGSKIQIQITIWIHVLRLRVPHYSHPTPTNLECFPNTKDFSFLQKMITWKRFFMSAN